jgi:aspartokinase/homoserine dehydrogenase 1
MLVLKFGGSSVAHESAIRQVAQIIQSYAQKERVTVVLSAMGGITDLLVNALNSASNREATYQTLINEIEKTHLDAVKSLIPVSIQS